LVSAPVYVEHVAVPNAVRKVTKAEWDCESLWYEAEIYGEDTADRISKNIVKHVSVGADHETVDILDGKVPHGLHNAELGRIAVPGVPDASIHVLEKLHAEEQALGDSSFTFGVCRVASEDWIGSKKRQIDVAMAMLLA
jgi:hypothetical protein